ncbi:MAG TPA: hypothetical protein PKE16_10135 [Hyphomicrobium sp.]|nr:hypothetical protein [Hyphomicrobium sp.]
MTNELPKPSFSHAIERHIQTILLTVVCGLLAWNYSTTQQAQVDLAALRAQTEQLRADVNKLQATVERTAADTYSRTQATADRVALELKIDKLDERVRTLERGR